MKPCRTMDPKDVRVAVSHFLDLVANGRGDEADNVRFLVAALDMLAWMQHMRDVRESPGPHPAPPEREYDKMRALVRQQFPSFGYYSTPAHPADQNGEAELIAGDAGADLATIACELYDVAWLFQTASEAAALDEFASSYAERWRRPLRTLQWYIERRRGDWNSSGR